MLIAAMASLTSLVAAVTSGPEQVVTLTCSGTQASWRAEGGSKMSLPWSRTYTVYLKARRYCEARCRTDTYLDEGDGSQLVLGDYGYGPGSTRLTYTAATNALYGHQVVDLGQRVSSGPRSALHLETTGTCAMTLGTPTGSGGAAAVSPTAPAG